MTFDLDDALTSEQSFHSDLPGGYVDLERRLPLLLVHRVRAGEEEAVRLLHGHSSVLVIDADEPVEQVRRIVDAFVTRRADEFGACIVVELWTVPPETGRARFRVHWGPRDAAPQPAQVLHAALERVPMRRTDLVVESHGGTVPAPSDLEPILEPDQATAAGCLLLGLEVPALYREPDGTAIYPAAVTSLRDTLAAALRETFFEFIRLDTSFEIEDHRELGRRNLMAAGLEVDTSLTALAARLDFLLHITPVNADAEFEAFRASGYQQSPAFHYRFLAFDPALVKRELYDLRIEEVTDPIVASLMREKRLELDRMITMLEDRATPRFLPGSLSLYPSVEDELLAEAETILSKVEPSRARHAQISPEVFAARAEDEIAHYRGVSPGMQAHVRLRDDMPGVMVSRGVLHLSARTPIAAHRVMPLLQHEVGTHIVTFENGLAQPLTLFSVGLAGYEQTQEGLAMLSEYVSGGLDGSRLRMIAARVVAVNMVVRGAGFVDVFRRMHRDLELMPATAWSVAMRARRGGGSTKDAIYLRGLLAVLDYLAAGNDLDHLLIGKVDLGHVAWVEELLWRRVLEPPRLRPRWLEMDGASDRLARLREGVAVTDLVEV